MFRFTLELEFLSCYGIEFIRKIILKLWASFSVRHVKIKNNNIDLARVEIRKIRIFYAFFVFMNFRHLYFTRRNFSGFFTFLWNCRKTNVTSLLSI